jgi:hypothetical protein
MRKMVKSKANQSQTKPTGSANKPFRISGSMEHNPKGSQTEPVDRDSQYQERKLDDFDRRCHESLNQDGTWREDLKAPDALRRPSSAEAEPRWILRGGVEKIA